MTVPTTLQLFTDNRPRIIAYLRALGAADEAEDLAHDVWLRLDRLENREKLSTSYIMRVAHNLLIDQIRAGRQRRRREELYHRDGDGGGETDQAPDAERVLLSRERLVRLEAALADLGPRTKQIVQRHRVDGVPQRVLAEELGITVSAIEKQLQKAYKLIASFQLEQDATGYTR